MRHERLLGYVLGGLLVVLGFVAAYQFVEPAPPRHLVLAAGPEDGAYWGYAQQYRAVLERSGISLEVRPTAGSVQNLDLLNDPASGVQAAIVQSGLLPGEGARDLAALGSLFVEPVWIFTRLRPLPERLDQLRGQRIAIGAERSGTQALTRQLLAASGVEATDAVMVPLGGQAAADALLGGDVDAVVLVNAVSSPVVRRLAETPGVGLVSLERAAAYAQIYPFLRNVVLHEGALNLERGLPDRDVELLAPKASLLVNGNLHPALIDILMVALKEIHGSGDVFSAPGTFPSPNGVDVPVAAEAQRFYDRGPPFLMRYMPFWAATLLDRTAILALPVITLLLPLARILPSALDWRMKSRVWRWYSELAAIERRAAAGEAAAAREELARVERDVAQMRLPTSHAHLAYHLRQHLYLVRRRLDDLPPPTTAG